MNPTNEDLWPADFAAEFTDKAPLVILREQALKLGEKTSNIVEARVSTKLLGDGELDIRFILVAPALGGYEYVLLEATQPVELYPVELSFEGKCSKAKNESEFKNLLGEVFKSLRTRTIISGLIQQSKSI